MVVFDCLGPWLTATCLVLPDRNCLHLQSLDPTLFGPFLRTFLLDLFDSGSPRVAVHFFLICRKTFERGYGPKCSTDFLRVAALASTPCQRATELLKSGNALQWSTALSIRPQNQHSKRSLGRAHPISFIKLNCLVRKTYPSSTSEQFTWAFSIILAAYAQLFRCGCLIRLGEV